MKYNFTGFSQKASEALNNALTSAEKLGHTYIGSEHILLGITSIAESSAARVLASFGVDNEKLTEIIKTTIGYGNKTVLTPDLMTPRAKRIIELSVVAARESGKAFVGTEHLLLGILKDNENYALKFILALNAAPDVIISKLNDEGDSKAEIQKKKETKKTTKTKAGSVVDQFGIDLTKLAIEGKVGRAIGREEETNRILGILSRKSKNNPCLIGEPGVGKTAVVEGVAARISAGDVPEILSGKRIIQIDLTSVVAGTKYRGDFEERIKNIIEEASVSDNIILFVDEIHTIVGAGSAEGSTDAANILKPYLSRGEIRLIGATTISEYRKTIEKDSALQRRFQPVKIEEPNESEAVDILMGLKPSYEEFHKITIEDSAIKKAVELSSRFINDRFLPDKAIDLIDEASAKIKLNMHISENKNTDETDKKEIPKLTEKDIAKLVSDVTGIPVTELTKEESERLIELETELEKNVIGQSDAAKKVCNAIRRSRLGLQDPKRPIGCFIFLGPSGVGKTEFCKALSRILFGSEKMLIKVDMTEYSEKHSISKLIGSPPGYVGFEEGGQLTEKIRRKPYSVVLFDEIEKAHPDIMNMFLNILDEGSITDSQGRKVSFKNTIIVMTSNLGARIITDEIHSMGFFTEGEGKEENALKKKVLEELKHEFKPEFLNRVDSIIVFDKLSKDSMKKICKNMLRELTERINKRGIAVDFSENLVNYLVDKGYDTKLGARPLRRLIETDVENSICEKMLCSDFNRCDNIYVDCNNDKILVNCK